MTPALLDILTDADKDILRTEKVFYNYVNSIMQEFNIPLTNDPDLVSAIVKEVDLYESRACNCILDTLEK